MTDVEYMNEIRIIMFCSWTQKNWNNTEAKMNLFTVKDLVDYLGLIFYVLYHLQFVVCEAL